MFKLNKASLVAKILSFVVLIIILLVTILILNNLYFYKIMQNNIYSTSKNALSVSIANTESNLKNITEGLDEFAYNNLDKITNIQYQSELDKYLSSKEINNLLIAKISSDNKIDCLFVSDPASDILLSQFNTRIDGKEKVDIIQKLKNTDNFENDTMNSNWYILSVNQSNYFIHSYHISGIYIGALVKADTLMAPIDRSSTNQYKYFLTLPTGKIIYSTDYNNSILGKNTVFPNQKNMIAFKNYTIVTDSFNLCNIKISVAEKNKNLFGGMDFTQWMIMAVSLILLIVLPVFIYNLFKMIINPLHLLIGATKQIERGNLDYQLPLKYRSMEFFLVFTSFNSMVSQIKNLKISSYEEKIERQKNELKFLQTQIRPHFFLNAISTISSLSLQGRNSDINKYIDVLSNHFRYVFKGGLTEVTLKEELSHSDNYIRMQQIKYPDNIYYMIDSDPQFDNIMLPHLIIETFIENIFKNAFIYEKMLSIFIKLEEHYIDGERFIQITIEDNGCGFPEEYLKNYQSQKQTESHIGIQNIRKTLSLFYGRDDLLQLSNNETGGATVKIRIPLREEMKEATR